MEGRERERPRFGRAARAPHATRIRVHATRTPSMQLLSMPCDAPSPHANPMQTPCKQQQQQQSVLMYLSTPEEGGETVFADAEFKSAGERQ